MTENRKPGAGDMMRITAENFSKLLLHTAEHIDKLEAEVLKLQHRVQELESAQDDFK